MTKYRYTMGKDIISQTKDQWTKTAMIEEIKYEFQKQELEYDPAIEELSADEMFDAFFMRTDTIEGRGYYCVDPAAVERYAEASDHWGEILQEFYIGDRWVVQLRKKMKTYSVTVFDGNEVKELYEDEDFFMAFHLMDKYIGSYVRMALSCEEEPLLVRFAGQEECDYD